MEAITETINGILSKRNDNQKSLTCSQDLDRKTQLVKAKYGDLDNCLQIFNPDNQATLAKRHDDSWITADVPTLALLNQTYGKTASVQWLVVQIYNLSEFCGCKDKLSTAQIHELSRIIDTSYYHLKLTELMMFFFNFKMGKYGKFYGAVDPMVITCALREFMDERNSRIDQVENERRRKQEEKEMKNAVSYEEYQKMKKKNK